MAVCPSVLPTGWVPLCVAHFVARFEPGRIGRPWGGRFASDGGSAATRGVRRATTNATGAGRSYPAPEVTVRAISEERARFVRRAYGHLAGALLAAAYALLQVPGLSRLADLMTTGWNWLVVLVLFTGASYVANRWARGDG